MLGRKRPRHTFEQQRRHPQLRPDETGYVLLDQGFGKIAWTAARAEHPCVAEPRPRLPWPPFVPNHDGKGFLERRFGLVEEVQPGGKLTDHARDWAGDDLEGCGRGQR